MGTSVFSVIVTKGDKFCDFLFASLDYVELPIMFTFQGRSRPIILLKQAFLRYVTEYVHLQARSFLYGINLPPSTILTRGNFCINLIASIKEGLLLKERICS